MNPSSAEPPSFTAPPGPDPGWSWRKWSFILILALAAHLGLVFLFGANQLPAPRRVISVPQFHLATGHAELMALTDPTLFVLPHEAADFVPSGWRVSPAAGAPAFSWMEPAPSLLPATNDLGAMFSSFLRTNPVASLTNDFKPPPRFAAPGVMTEPAVPQRSSVQITGELARRLIETPAAPVLAGSDILKPGRVQVLVDESGQVASAVLLEACEDEAADRKALEIARATRFKPAHGSEFGEMIFHWHTVPTNAP
jgi:TonB family protein